MQEFSKGLVFVRRQRFALLLWLSGLVLDAARLPGRVGLAAPALLQGGFRLSNRLSRAALDGWRCERAARTRP
jgi:hypothetical protein